MPDGDMVQAHLLTAYPASLLNRDDAGLAKRIPFGGAVRTRVSSQCLKKHWRESSGVTELGDLAVRSRRSYEQEVAQPLVAEHGASEEEARAIAEYLIREAWGAEAVDSDHPSRTSGIVVMSPKEIAHIRDVAVAILDRLEEEGVDASEASEVKKHAKLDRDQKKNFEELPASLDMAMFGRMVTSDLLAQMDSSVSVAHAFTTHAESAETDYFTAVDTLGGDDPGAALIQDAELTTGVFYLYAVLDMNQLRHNLGQQAEVAERLGHNLVQAMATVSPGAKEGSTAPYSYAEFVLLERGRAQPRTLANAFLDPVRANGANLMQASLEDLLDYRERMAEMHGAFEGDGAVSSAHDLPDDVDLDPVPLGDALGRIFQVGS